jgi:hypothetical protein
LLTATFNNHPVNKALPKCNMPYFCNQSIQP